MSSEIITLTQFLSECESNGTLMLSEGMPPAVAIDGMKSYADELARTAVLLISTDQVNRRGHIVNPMGGDLTNFKLNPIFMWNHLGYQDAMNIIGKVLNVTQEENGIKATVQYAHLEQNGLPDRLWELERKGLLPGNSIGIRPLGDIVRNTDQSTTIGRWELLDVSKVPVGSNGQAVTITTS